MCLVTFDASLFEIVGAFVGHRKLKPRNVRVLREMHDDLQRVLPALSGKGAEYFGEWEEIVRRTLRLADPNEDFLSTSS